MFVRLVSLSLLLAVSQNLWATNYYFGINYGAAVQDPKITVQDNSLDPAIPNVTYPKDYIIPDENVSAQSIYLGYRVGRDMAIEFGFGNTGEAEGDYHTVDNGIPTTDLVARDFSELSYRYLALVGVWPAGNNLIFNAKLGVANWKFDYQQKSYEVDTSNPTNPVLTLSSIDSYSDTGSDLFVSLGVGYGFSGFLEVRAEAMLLAFDPEYINVDVEQKVSLFTIGLVAHF